MPSNASRHLLPINSLLFSSNIQNARTCYSPVSAHPPSLTLANLQDAQDTSITALPQPPTINNIDAVTKDPVWRRFAAAAKKWCCCGRKRKMAVKENKTENEAGRQVAISEPTGFRCVDTTRQIGVHEEMQGLDVVRESESNSESEWEDVE